MSDFGRLAEKRAIRGANGTTEQLQICSSERSMVSFSVYLIRGVIMYVQMHGGFFILKSDGRGIIRSFERSMVLRVYTFNIMQNAMQNTLHKRGECDIFK